MNVEEKISAAQAVPSQRLKLVQEVRELRSEVLQWAKQFCKKKQCFSNALTMSILDDCHLVLGYVYFHDIGIAIEHAWNRDTQGDFDLTAQLFLPSEPATYCELVSFEPKDAQDWWRKGGVDHLKLRRDKDYRYLFR